MKRVLIVLVLSVVFANVGTTGILNRPGNGITARDLATSGGFTVADPEGASAILFNPAALTEIERWAWTLGVIGLTTNFSYDRDDMLGGNTFDAREEFFPLPYGAIAYRWNNLIFAFGFDAPYALATDYGDDLAFDSQTSFADIVAGLGYEVNDWLSLGVALKAVYGDVQLRMPLFDPTGTAFLGMTKTQADGWGYGYSLGTLIKLDPIAIGLTYEPLVKVDVDGRTDFPAAVGISSDGMDAHIYQPERLGIGAAWQAVDRLKLGASYFRTDYGKNDKVGIDYDNLPKNVMDLGWDIVDSVHLGAEYEVNDKWTLLGGGAWMSSGTPDYSPPSIPDGDGWCINGGVGYQLAEHTRVDIGISYYWADRDISLRPRNIAAGDHEMKGIMFGIGVSQEF